MADELIPARLEESPRALVGRRGVRAEPDLLALGRGLRQLARAFLDAVAQLGADPVAAVLGENSALRPQPVRMPGANDAAGDKRSVRVLDQPPVAFEVRRAVQPLDEERRIALVPVRAPECADEVDRGGRSSCVGRRKR